MTTFCIGCDNINGGESGYISKMASVFEKEGHTVENLGVGPSVVQRKGLNSSSSGKVGVYIVGGSDIGTYVDFRDGIGSYYHYKYAWFAFASWTAHTWITCDELKNRALVRAHDDNFSSSSSIAPYIGKSADDFFKDNKDKMNYVCGQTPEELAKKILAGGGNADDDGGEESTAATIKDSLKKACAPWDGEAEIRIIDDTVYVNKIHDPTETELLINEFTNVVYDSVTVSDVHPQTVNKITMNYNGKELSLKDDLMIERFGEVPITIEPDEFVTNYKEAIAHIQRYWNKVRRDSGRQVELKVEGNTKWKAGEWARVFLPGFNIDDYMYISRMSADEDNTGNWQTGLTLVDYTPSFNVEEEAETEEEEEEETEEDTEDTDTEV